MASSSLPYGLSHRLVSCNSGDVLYDELNRRRTLVSASRNTDYLHPYQTVARLSTARIHAVRPTFLGPALSIEGKREGAEDAVAESTGSLKRGRAREGEQSAGLHASFHTGVRLCHFRTQASQGLCVPLNDVLYV